MAQNRLVITPEMEQRLRELRASGVSVRVAAAELRIAKSTAAKRMAKIPKGKAHKPPKAPKASKALKQPGPHQQLQVKLKQAGVKIPESTEIITPATVKVQRHICIPPDYAPICAASVQGQYTGAGLSYRGQAKR